MKVSVLLLSTLAATAAPTATFYSDVLPILQRQCQGCHRPGEAAPMSLLTYEQVRPWAKAIKQSVTLGKMPPWFADRTIGNFHNERKLSPLELETISAWVDGGAPAGDASQAPKPVAFLDGWNIGTPQKIIGMPAPIDIQASGTIEYTYLILPTGFTEDRWVTSAEVRPGNRAVVHHVIAFVREPGSKWLEGYEPGVPFIPNRQGGGEGRGMGEFLVCYAPGVPPLTLEANTGKLVKAGSDIVLQLHYTANGKASTDQTRVGLVFADKPPAQRVLTVSPANPKLVIPPGAENHRVDTSLTLHEDTKLVSLFPHMHLRGKSFEYRAVYPTGETETLLRVPRYDFNWQLIYSLKGDKLLPKGTRIECTAHFDNSANNPDNPDPSKEVTWGEQSWEEMMIGFMEVAFDRHLSSDAILKTERKPSGE